MKLTLLSCALAIAGSAMLQAAAVAQDNRNPTCASGRESQAAVDRFAGNQTESLSKTLAPCNGVLKPPPVGDSELAIDPPDVGKTPIIRPGQLPDQS